LSFEFSEWRGGYSDGFSWSINPILNQRRPVKHLAATHGGMETYLYREEWCDANGCTLSGLQQTRGVPRWGSFDLWFWDGGFPTDAEKEARDPMSPREAEGLIVVD